MYANDALEIAKVGRGERVLDVAAGPGSLSIAAAKGGAQVVATDFSGVMVEQIQARVAREGVKGVEAQVMDGQALQLPDASFDAAFRMFGLMMFPDRAAGFREMNRVLKPQGRAVVAVWDKPPHNEWMGIFQEAVRKAMPDTPPPPPPVFMELADRERLAGEMRGGGFAQVEVKSVSHTLDVGAPVALWGVLMETNPAMPGMVARIGPEKAAAVREALVEAAQAKMEREGAPTVRLTADALMAVGRRP
ncbi:MAG TPA: methyltransferase domain-containing protein [Candidatus Thermoplasmatota archaeon]